MISYRFIGVKRLDYMRSDNQQRKIKRKLPTDPERKVLVNLYCPNVPKMGTIGSSEFNNRRLLAFQPSFSSCELLLNKLRNHM